MLHPAAELAPVEWRMAANLVPYDEAVATMAARAAAIADGHAPELVWLIEHPPLYTAGTSAKAEELIEARFPVHTTGRGGQLTYHGPGQRVAYVMLDLKRRGPDVRRFVVTLEEWIIRTLASFGVEGGRRDERIGVWVPRPDKGAGHEDKIAAIGIRVQRWVTLHGIAINVAPELAHFSGIVPCGVSDARYGVTSLADLGVRATHGGGGRGAAAGVRDDCSEGRRPRASARAHTVGSTENPSPPCRSARSAGPASRTSTASTRALAGPRRQASIMASTASAGPANTASTVPSRRLRTQPSRPLRIAVSSVQAR